MAKTRILLDSNAYLRLANSFHPLLNESFQIISNKYRVPSVKAGMFFALEKKKKEHRFRKSILENASRRYLAIIRFS